MEVKKLETETIVISGAVCLDPVTVVFHDHEPGRGGMIVECYGLAWSAFWGAMGDRKVRGFVAQCDADYLLNRLWKNGERRTKAGEAYLMRICEAIKAALVQEGK